MKNVLRNEKGSVAAGAIGTVIALALGIALLFGTSFGWAHFRLWKATYTGKALEIEKRYEGMAVLAEAEYSRQAKVESAQAEYDSAQLIADSIEIVGEMAKKYPEYRKQEFISAFGEALRNGQIDQIVYVATELGIPVTEAGRIAGK